MTLACEYHQRQGEELGFALGKDRITKDEASAERRTLAKEIAECPNCVAAFSAVSPR